MRWHSCTRAVTGEGTARVRSAKLGAVSPVLSGEGEGSDALGARANSSPRTTLALFPEVEIPTTRSPGRHSASTWRGEDRLEPEVVRAGRQRRGVGGEASEARPRRFRVKRTVNSVAKCCESAALPPLPKKQIFPPSRRQATIRAAISAIVRNRLLETGHVPGGPRRSRG